ncbi:hypothetical protein [Pontibacter cellulosilyticus]|uniref:Uncharacterized protein n=1 Tax=Pontibacter cellulosilyticus TaxID=1720253 RepID=A0A923N4B3_9BACT|nr:hypothetical protein [Pontibacter cellulosilyticus]MBC5991986.1 hypothetical protein [Pontibacter cellulosilyticus]
MRLVGNISDIKNKRDSKNADIEIYINKIEYITYKKDGKYFQPFDYEVELDIPFVLTGDCLSQTSNSQPKEGEYEFNVYEKVDGKYELNPNKQLSVSTTYVEEAGILVLTSVYYTVVISNEEFQELKRKGHKERVAKKGKKR